MSHDHDGHGDGTAEFEVDDGMGEMREEVHQHDAETRNDGAQTDTEVRADDDTVFAFERRDGYLAVRALTPYNRHALPYMEIESVVERDGETVFDDRLVPTSTEPATTTARRSTHTRATRYASRS